MENSLPFGVFSKNDLLGLISSDRIMPLNGFEIKHVGPASVDLTVSGGFVYELRTAFKPSSRKNETVRELLTYFGVENGARKVMVGEVLYPGKSYLAKASVDVNFPPGVYAFANAKSTSGRNFLLVRVIADYCGEFDSVDKRREGYTGEVWFLMQPLVFPVVLTDKEAYIQMRVFDGDTRFNERDLQVELQKTDFLHRHDGKAYKQGELSLFAEDGSILTTLWAKAGKLVGFKVLPYTEPLDLTARGLEPAHYFEPVYAKEDPSDKHGGLIEIHPSCCYLLSTNERFNVPAYLCSELKMLDPRLGLYFSHFAGFFDPGFFGTPTLEVVPVMPTVLRHKDVVARFGLERMRSETLSYASAGNYAGQVRTTLPKQFKMPEAWQIAMR